MKTLIEFFRNLFSKKSTTVAAKVISKTFKLRPTEEMFLARQQELMDLLFYGPLKILAIENSDNSYSYTYKEKSNRVKFTARGAFLNRNEINEKYLFNISNYTQGTNIVTASLTQHTKNRERSIFRETVLGVFKTDESIKHVDTTFLEQADRETLSKLGETDKLWRMVLDNMHMSLLYMFDHRDLTFISERLFRTLFKAIAVEELMPEGPDKITLRDRYREDIFEASQACMFPLSLNAFTSLRNSLPIQVSSRMSTVKFKLKMIQQDRYESPVAASQLRGF